MIMLPEGFETLSEVLERRRDLVHELEKSPATTRLTKIIGRCRKGKRCSRQACPICRRFTRIRWLKFGMNLIKGMPPDAPVVVTTIIPSALEVPEDELATLATRLPKVMNTLRQNLGRSALKDTVMLGGFDLALTSFDEAVHQVPAGQPPVWQGHLDVISFGAPAELVRRTIRPWFTASATRPKPVMVKEVDRADVASRLTYTMKPFMSDRRVYIGKNGRRETKTFCLSGEPLCDCSLLTAELGFQGMRFLRNARWAEPASKKKCHREKASEGGIHFIRVIMKAPKPPKRTGNPDF